MLPEHLLRHGIGAAHFHLWVPSTRHEADHWSQGCSARSDTYFPGEMSEMNLETVLQVAPPLLLVDADSASPLLADRLAGKVHTCGLIGR